jgi:hypothetical protein
MIRQLFAIPSPIFLEFCAEGVFVDPVELFNDIVLLRDDQDIIITCTGMSAQVNIVCG